MRFLVLGSGFRVQGPRLAPFRGGRGDLVRIDGRGSGRKVGRQTRIAMTEKTLQCG